MNGIDASGRKVTVNKSSRRARTSQMAEWTDEQIRGFFARILRADNIPPSRAARILRTSRTTLYRDASTAKPIDELY